MLKPKQVFPPLASPQVLPVFYHRQATSADTSTQLSFLELYSPEINAPTLFHCLPIYYETLDCSPIACLSDLHACVCSNRGSLGIPAGTITPTPTPSVSASTMSAGATSKNTSSSQLIFSSIKQRGLGWKSDSSTGLRSRSHPE